MREIFGIGGVTVFSMQNDSGEEEIYVGIGTPEPIALLEKLNAASCRPSQILRIHLVCIEGTVSRP